MRKGLFLPPDERPPPYCTIEINLGARDELERERAFSINHSLWIQVDVIVLEDGRETATVAFGRCYESKPVVLIISLSTAFRSSICPQKKSVTCSLWMINEVRAKNFQTREFSVLLVCTSENSISIASTTKKYIEFFQPVSICK